jgi:hypothetical protein
MIHDKMMTLPPGASATAQVPAVVLPALGVKESTAPTHLAEGEYVILKVRISI